MAGSGELTKGIPGNIGVLLVVQHHVAADGCVGIFL